MKTGFFLCVKLHRENPVLALYRIAVRPIAFINTILIVLIIGS